MTQLTEMTNSACRPGRKSMLRSSFIFRHWRGDLSLGVSYWVIGFIGNIVLLGLTAVVLLVSRELSRSAYDPTASFVATVLVWTFIGLIAIWQIVGVWRSATRYGAEKRQLSKGNVWGTLAKVMIVLGALRILDSFAGQAIPLITSLFQIAFEDDPSIPAYSIRVMRNDHEAELSGGIKYGVTDDLIQIMKAVPQISVLHLDSIGGRIGEAERLNELIHDKGLITYVSSKCLSACTLAFIGGRERWLLEGAKLGFHAPSMPGLANEDVLEFVNRQRKIFASAGVGYEFIEKALSTPNDNMWEPSVGELLDAHVVTAISSGNEFAASGIGGNITRNRLIDEIVPQLPLLKPLEDRYPKEFNTLIDRYYKGYTDGLTRDELIIELRSAITSILLPIKANADDDVLVEFGHLIVDQYRAIGQADSADCFLYASGTGTPKNLNKELPYELQKRELQLEARILETAKTRPALQEAAISGALNTVIDRMSQRFGPKSLSLFQKSVIEPNDYNSYCQLTTAFYEETISLPEAEAALLMRYALTPK